jgi:hypothetical protein
MKLQLHNVQKITLKRIEEFTRANGKSKHHDFKTLTIIIEVDGQKFEIDLFSEQDLTIENLNA